TCLIKEGINFGVAVTRPVRQAISVEVLVHGSIDVWTRGPRPKRGLEFFAPQSFCESSGFLGLNLHLDTNLRNACLDEFCHAGRLRRSTDVQSERKAVGHA